MNNGLKFLAVSYFLIELLINFTLYKQLSLNSNIYGAGSLEMWGKVVIGFGMALLIVQLLNVCGYDFSLVKNDELKLFGGYRGTFLKICVITIPLSFFIQDKIVDAVVKSADEATLNNAIIVAAAKSTIVPYYNYQMAIYPKKDVGKGKYWKIFYPIVGGAVVAPKHYHKAQNNFFVTASQCTKYGEKLFGVDKNIDKAFFAFSRVRNQDLINEAVYKEAIKDFYSCLYEDTTYQVWHIRGIDNNAKNQIRKQHASFISFSETYEENMRPAKGNKDSALIKRIDREWKEGMSRFIGSKTSMQPDTYMEFNDFIAHPDVKKGFYKQAGPDAIWPYGPEWYDHIDKTISEFLPDSVIKGYMNVDGSVIGDQEEYFWNKNAGKGYYKAIIMPIVGLSLSGLFLVFNLITMLTTLIARLSYSKAFGFFVIALSWSLIWPNRELLTAKTTGTETDKIDMVINVVYYHEANLAAIYDTLFIHRVSAERAEEYVVAKRERAFAIAKKKQDKAERARRVRSIVQ